MKVRLVILIASLFGVAPIFADDVRVIGNPDYIHLIMEKHTYMLGWWHCGYIEQWAPAGTHLEQQCGFFSPFGEPRTDLLPRVKEANGNAVKWHRERF